MTHVPDARDKVGILSCSVQFVAARQQDVRVWGRGEKDRRLSADHTLHDNRTLRSPEWEALTLS
jgi:hypothetical protein